MEIEVSLDFLFKEWDWASRIAKCADLGIHAIEFGDWRHDPSLLKLLLREYNVEIVGISGDSWRDGKVEHAVTNRENHSEFLLELDKALTFARTCNARNIVIDTGCSVAGATDEQMMDNVVQALSKAADTIVESGFRPLLEPLNRDNHPGYFLHSIDTAAWLSKKIGSGTKLLVDIFHSTKEEGPKLAEKLRQYKELLGDIIHVADVPDRHEPGTGKIDWHRIMKTIRAVEFSGWIGLEFIPTKKSEEAIADCRRTLNI